MGGYTKYYLTARFAQDAKYAKKTFLSDRVIAGLKTNRQSTIRKNS
jgi:hypothetical protein